MSGRVRSCSSYQRELLADHWEMAVAGSGEAPSTGWLAAVVPGTVASSLREVGQWSLDAGSRAFDAEEWWYRCRFAGLPPAAGERVVLGFDGLATLADVWLNGSPLGQSTNMFQAHEYDISALVQPGNELLIRFAALQPFLEKKRPRPRWRTPMVAHPQLRWVRTTLLGRTPGWSPPSAAVGPWRPVWLERRRMVELEGVQLRASLRGRIGELQLTGCIQPLQGVRLKSASAHATRLGQSQSATADLTDAAAADFQATDPQAAGAGAAALGAAGLGVGRRPGAAGREVDSTLLHAKLDIPNAALWWPHTHGEPALYEVTLQLCVTTADGGESRVEVGLGSVGFRTVSLDRSGGDFCLIVNGERIFCRGAVWTPLDCVSLNATPADYLAALAQVRAAGMNMLRVAGPFVYENETFVELCDAQGILLWQEFMFANMDYPEEDPQFGASVALEARQLLSQLQARPSLAVLCGNSEVSQQAAMSGAPRERWSPALFETTLAGYAREYCPDVAYCPSSAHGGDFPFTAAEGVTSYYGVGAYLQPLTDARRSELKFASECLALANVPEGETLADVAGQPLHFNQPRWKERVPRDRGAGWDFDDVRDHYLARLFRVDVAALRYSDQERYLQLSRATSGEVMAGAFREWRRARSVCRGALLLFLRDLWPGAGWGVIDSNGLPKAAYYYLKRVLAEVALFVTEEGSNGLTLHVVNDGAHPVDGQLHMELYKESQPVGRRVSRPVVVEPRSVLALNATLLLDGFADLSYAYRFGPPSYDVLRVIFDRGGGSQPLEAYHFPLGLPNTQTHIGLRATARVAAERVELEVSSRDFAQAVHIEAPGYVADDQYFHLAPQSSRTLILQRRAPGPLEFEATARALNALTPCRVELVS